MAGFCRNCGSPLADGQGFCIKCGTRVGESAAAGQPVAAPPAAAAPPASAQYSPAAAPSTAAASSSSALKIVLVIVVVLGLFGALGVASMMYIGYRVRQKAHEMGIDSHTFEEHKSTLTGVDVCALLSKDAVSQATGLEVLHTERQPGSNPGCAYYVAGDAADLTAKHATQMHKGEMTKQQQDMMENFGKTVLHSSTGDAGASEHPGEVPVLTLGIDENAAVFQMKLSRGTFSRLGPVALTDIPNLGDEAFDISGAMLMARKGDKLVRIMYMQCPCGTAEIVPLAKKVVDGL